jgi:hypothetical protein
LSTWRNSSEFVYIHWNPFVNCWYEH